METGQDNHVQPLFYAHPKERREEERGRERRKKCEVEKKKKELCRPNSSQGEKKKSNTLKVHRNDRIEMDTLNTIQKLPGELNGVILSGQSQKIAEQVNHEKIFSLYIVVNLSVTNFHHNLLLTELENLGFTNQYQNIVILLQVLIRK